MRLAQPPKIATWLLIHFGSSPNNASLVGDLNEQYRQGIGGRCWLHLQVSDGEPLAIRFSLMEKKSCPKLQ
jgi:hypothetical protein